MERRDHQSSPLNFDTRFGFSMPEVSEHKTVRGLTEETVLDISRAKDEPDWMREFRLKSYEIFKKKKLPTWGPDLSGIDFGDITYYLKATKTRSESWDELPAEIKETYDRIGVPEAEKKYLSGVSAQYESEVVYESVNRELERLGVIFCDMDTAVKKHPELVRKYFGTLIPPTDNMFAALNSAVWSGGSFVYVPKGVRVDLPLQAYFRINAERFGQFERTLIIADEGSFVHYTEGCTAPVYSTDSLHAAVVEVFALKKARVRYTTVQNWSNNIYNLVTKRAQAGEDAVMEWVDCNIGSKVTMKYPSVYLVGKGAHGDMLSIAIAGAKQIQDAGSKMYHLAPETTSRVLSKSISKNGGQTSYRGVVHIGENAARATTSVTCDAMMFDSDSRSDTYPAITVDRGDAIVEHEATMERIGEEKRFAIESRGVSREDAESLLVNGFIEPVSKEIPMEYSIELNRLIRYEMSKKIG